MPDNSLAWMRNDEADERMNHLHRRFVMRRTMVDISSLTSKRMPQIDGLRGEALERVAEYLGCDPHIGRVLADRIAREWRRAGHTLAGPTPVAGVPVIPPTGVFTYAP